MNYSSNGIIQSNYALESSHQQNRKFQVMIVSCIVKADDTSKESIQLSSKLGLRLRKILSDQSVTASSFARSFVEKSKSYIRAVCDELSGDSNSNVTLSYGDGSKTNVMIRHDTKSGKPVFVGSLLMQIKLAENGMTSLVLPKGKHNEIISFGSSLNRLILAYTDYNHVQTNCTRKFKHMNPSLQKYTLLQQRVRLCGKPHLLTALTPKKKTTKQ
jgi:hypothetical protein